MPSGVEVVLKEQGVDPDELALVLEQDAVGTTAEKIPHGAMPKPDGILLTGPAEEIVEGSLALSQKLGHMETGSEHIFLSMLQSNDSDAGRKLEEKGLTFTDAEGKIRSLYP
jgi:ATP-dependent Clp protease ATP-binding subunit ClpA